MSIEIDDSTPSMLWSQTQDRRLKDSDVSCSTRSRQESLMSIWWPSPTPSTRAGSCFTRLFRAGAELCVGDRVMFTNRIRPRYLEHELAEVTGVDDRTVTVRLWRPVGRFGEAKIRCPPLALRKVRRGT